MRVAKKSIPNQVLTAREEARRAVATKIDKIIDTFSANASQAAFNAAKLQTVCFYTMKSLEALSGELKGNAANNTHE